MSRYTLSSFVAGLIFGLGLLVSGMANPEKVLGFLDLAGAWDPSLALVMVGAIATAFVAFRIAGTRPSTLLGSDMMLPTKRRVDRRLLAGSLVFGMGWGIAGFCPGPGLVAMGAGEPGAMVFVAAMIGGMVLMKGLEAIRPKNTEETA